MCARAADSPNRRWRQLWPRSLFPATGQCRVLTPHLRESGSQQVKKGSRSLLSTMRFYIQEVRRDNGAELNYTVTEHLVRNLLDVSCVYNVHSSRLSQFSESSVVNKAGIRIRWVVEWCHNQEPRVYDQFWQYWLVNFLPFLRLFLPCRGHYAKVQRSFAVSRDHYAKLPRVCIVLLVLTCCLPVSTNRHIPHTTYSHHVIQLVPGFELLFDLHSDWSNRFSSLHCFLENCN